MPLKSNYLFIASMDVDREHESIFHEVYDQEHIPNLSDVPGVLSVARFQRQEPPREAPRAGRADPCRYVCL